SDSGLTAKRNWWVAAREVLRATKGKGIVVSGGLGVASQAVTTLQRTQAYCKFVSFLLLYLLVLSSHVFVFS
ncbi:hypothetical protein DFH29DRAFT_858231, partial [Suillus ampliporus]